MFSGPRYSKPTHQYGESFGDQAEVLDGTELLSCPCGRGQPELCDQHGAEHSRAPYVPLHGWFCHCGRAWPCPLANPHWAGQGFTVPYEEPAGE